VIWVEHFSQLELHELRFPRPLTYQNPFKINPAAEVTTETIFPLKIEFNADGGTVARGQFGLALAKVKEGCALK
jgi:hypothetical protein